MDKPTKKALVMGVIAYFLTRDFRMVVIIALASWLVDRFL